MAKSCLSEFLYQLHDGPLNGRVIIHACGSYQKLLLSNSWVMQKYLQATSVAQKELCLLWLRLSQTHNLGLHFDNRSWMKEGEANVCGWKDSGPGMWSSGPDQKGRKGGRVVKRKPHEGKHVLFVGSLAYPSCCHSCLVQRICELNIS